MPQVTLQLVRRHGYVRLKPTANPGRSVFEGENGQHWANQWQDITCYRSGDGRYELAIEMTEAEAENPPAEIQIDVP